MKRERLMVLGVVALASAVALTGCAKQSESDAGVAERTGAALDTATGKTVEGAKATAEAAKEVTGKVVEKTGEALQTAGDAVEGAGTGMRDENEPTITDE